MVKEDVVYTGILVGISGQTHNKVSHNFFGFPVHITVTFILYCGLLSVQ